jgi:ElaB/YqjD/DUF883 family membrane-anchored ribosome-binding protein
MTELNTPTAHDMNQAVDQAADSAKNAADAAKSTVERARAAAHDYVERGSQGVRDSAAKIKDSWGNVADRTASYVHEQPMKAILIAAAAGAAIAMLSSLLAQNRNKD